MSGTGNIGGIVNMGNVSKSYGTGNVTGTNTVGGLVAMTPDVRTSYFTGTVKGDDVVGGIAGVSDVTENCYTYLAKVQGTGSSVGTLLGYNSGNIDNCFVFENPGDKVPYTYEKDRIPTEFQFQVGIKSDSASQIHIDLGFEMNDLRSIRGIGTSTSSAYLDTLDKMLARVSSKQTDYGACQNRLESVLEEISTQYDNLVSSRSTLRDADVAKVSSEYIRQQILQQASATLLSTANQTPALALQLI